MINKDLRKSLAHKMEMRFSSGAGTTLVEYGWWCLQNMDAVSESKADMVLMWLSSTNMAIPKEKSTKNHHKLPLASLAPLNMVTPLLNPPFLPPTVYCALVKVKSAILHLAEAVHIFLSYPSGGIKELSPSLNALVVLDLEYHITGYFKKM